MKRTTLIIIILGMQLMLHAQKYNLEIRATYSFVNNHGLIIGPEFYVKNHSFYIGTRIQINDNDYYKNGITNSYFYRTGYAKKAKDFFGINFGYSYNIKIKKLPNFIPFISYDFEYSHIGSRYKEVNGKDGTLIDSMSNTIIGRRFLADIEDYPYGRISNTFCIGFKIKISSSVLLTSSAGIGIMYMSSNIIGFNKTLNSLEYQINSDKMPHEFVGFTNAPLLRMGISYRFSEKLINKKKKVE